MNASDSEVSDPQVRNNLEALEHLRSQTFEDVASAVTQTKALLGQAEAYALMRELRWPQGIVCPTCGSSRIRRVDHAMASPESVDDEESFKQHYECMHCSEHGRPAFFNDLSGLPLGHMGSVPQWILSWFLLNIASPIRLAELLHVPLSHLLQIASTAKELRVLPREEFRQSFGYMQQQLHRKKTEQDAQKKDEHQEEIKSSRDIYLSPKPKSRK